MTLTAKRPAAQGPNLRRVFGWLAAGLLALALLAVVTAPPLRRYLANPTGAAAQAGVTSIDVAGDWFQNHLYAPSVVRVPVGTTVTWNFVDRGVNGTEEPVAHNVVGDGWGSPLLSTGSWQHTFDTPGTFRYVCTLHSGMDGVVEVGAP